MSFPLPGVHNALLLRTRKLANILKKRAGQSQLLYRLNLYHLIFMENQPAALPSPPALHEASAPDGTQHLKLTGTWNLRGIQALLGALRPRLNTYARLPNLSWDLQDIDVLDHAGAVLLWRAWGKKKASKLTLRPEHEALFERLNTLSEPASVSKPRDALAPLIFLGERALLLKEHVLGFLALLGRLVLDLGYLARHPLYIPWREISANLYRTGAQALAITGLVSLLIGVVLSFLFSKQLRVFGADIYIIDILGISIFRELGPVLAAILVAGRSGSSMTAQLGVMRVTQELDALSVMGISHSVRLVLPKVIALAISLPLLVLWADAVALLGGALAAKAQLGIGVFFFMSQLPDAVPIANVWLGISKGVVFGFLIALIACHFGLR
ncbi:MAG: ABC transporter permease, partial [Gammaproteobacteria bacterium]